MAGSALGDLVIAVSTDLGGLKAGLKTIPNLLDTFLRGGIFEAGKNLAENIIGMPKDFIAEAVKLSAGWERATTEIEVFTGSATKAANVMRELRTFAAESPLALSDTILEAKRLFSAGVTDNQIIPTMRMLSDLSVGSRTNLNRLTKAYTDVLAAGRLYGTELRQFTETGIPLIKSLSEVMKKPQEEIRSMMEAGRVGTGDLQKALKKLTAEGGLFFGMTERGAQTLEGQFEKLLDAAEDLKREFGKAIIEEVGFKDIIKDGTKFTDEMKQFIGDLRPGIRLVGDVIKGVGNVVAELVRSGPVFAEAFGKALREASPTIAHVVDSLVAGIKALKDFRLDPRAVVAAAFDFAAAVGTAIEAVFTATGNLFGDLYDRYGKGVVDSLGRFIEDLKAISDVMREVVSGIREAKLVWDRPKRALEISEMARQGKIPDREAFEKERFEADGFKDLLAKLDKAANRRLTLQEIGNPQKRFDTEVMQHGLKFTIGELKELRQQQAEMEYASKFDADLDNAMKADELKKEYEAALVKKFQQSAIPKAEALDRGGAFVLRGVDLAKKTQGKDAILPPLADSVKKVMGTLKDDLMKKAEVMMNTRINPLASTVTALDVLAGGAYAAAKGLYKVEVAVDELARFKAKLVELKPVLEPPSKQFAEQWNDLLEMRTLGQRGKLNDPFGRNQFGEREFNLAAADLFKKFQPQGMSEVKLPTAAEYGSGQVAELVARANAATGMTTNNLLQQILATEAEQLAEARRQTDAFLRQQPQMIVLPPW